ncbi:uncharacterized protein LOC114360522 [Ostrinia furnacalis]|uniref:uncharacterized protein LOC114360522 n=1 Tax=Ostrinia furnacalis TaxID=93504 RepID=UPI001039AB56|nr:uncharacterized protein LOC114360522 [Ostrinia furnacalis]
MLTMIAKYLILLSIASLCFCQRPFYAGKRPIGFPEIITDGNANNIGSSETKPSHEKPSYERPSLPPQLKGDQGYADILSHQTLDHQPFWFINKQQYDEFRKHPKTYPQRPSYFNDHIPVKHYS